MKKGFKKIGVLRANALGDFILSLPAIEALKKAHREAEIVLLGRKTHAELYQQRKWPIDRVIALPAEVQFDETIKENTEVKESVVNDLRSEGFDLVVQLHGGGGYSNLFINELNAKFTVGPKVKEAPSLDLNLTYADYQHEVIRQLEIVQKVGAEPGGLEPRFSASDEEISLARNFFKGSLESENMLRVLINPGATDPKRRWPVKNFIYICKELLKKEVSVIVNTGPGEEKIQKEMKKEFLETERIIFLNPKLPELTGLLAISDLILSNDTGTFHLSLALKRPTVGLFWFRNLLTYGPLTSSLNKVLTSWEVSCPECGQNCSVKNCSHESSIISSISREEVLESVLDFLNLN